MPDAVPLDRYVVTTRQECSARSCAALHQTDRRSPPQASTCRPPHARRAAGRSKGSGTSRPSRGRGTLLRLRSELRSAFPRVRRSPTLNPRCGSRTPGSRVRSEHNQEAVLIGLVRNRLPDLRLRGTHAPYQHCHATGEYKPNMGMQNSGRHRPTQRKDSTSHQRCSTVGRPAALYCARLITMVSCLVPLCTLWDSARRRRSGRTGKGRVGWAALRRGRGSGVARGML